MSARYSATIDQLETSFRFDLAKRLDNAKMLKAIICEDTVKRCTQQYGEHLHAIVLTGSLARDEATVVAEAESWRVLGDAEFLLVFRERSQLPNAVDVDGVCADIEQGLLRRKMRCHVSLSANHPNYLRRLRPHIFAYELRNCGQIVWGQPQTLSLIQAFDVSEIPLEDAWRLLCNRMIELLEAVGDMTEPMAGPSPIVQYRTIKLYLDMATSYLVFVGAYAPTYRGRADNIKMLGQSLLVDNDGPFPHLDFAERVLACTRVKLLGLDAINAYTALGRDDLGLGAWTEAVAYAELLWRWELVRLTGLSLGASKQALWESWARQQSVSQRLRGWLYVLRARGWRKSWRDWPRWVRQGWGASPRYWVYAAASELFFELPQLVATRGQWAKKESDWEERRRWLPVSREANLGSRWPAWRALASDVVWNYHEFLERTRA